MSDTYPTYTELIAWGYTTEPLDIGVSALEGLGYRIAPEATARSQEKRSHKRYLSDYVGVTMRRGRWVAQWGRTKSKAFGTGPEGELQAAWHRARVLGLAEPEVRQ